jgi:hypothetical protein
MAKMNMKKYKKGGWESWSRLAIFPALLSTWGWTGDLRADQTNVVLPTNVDREFLQKLVDQVNQDSAQIKDLKGQLVLKNSMDEGADTPAAPKYPSLQFHGFADIDYHASSRLGIPNVQGVTYNPPSDHAGNSFFLGELDLYMQSQLAEDISVLNETVISSGPNNYCGVDIERLELSWHPSDYFNVDFGRFHTALGYYNTEYHHGTWFQNAVGRPFFLEYEDSGGLLPVHMVGVSVHGAIPSGKLNLGYFAEVGNGRNYTASGNPVQNEIDANRAKALNLALVAKPDWFPGGQFGAGAYYDSVTADGQPPTDEWIWNTHVVYHSSAWELMAEGFLISHQAAGERAHYSPMYYVQAGRRFGQYTPYVRFTYVNTSRYDPIYTTILNQAGLDYGPSIGLRYDFSTYVALKLQYDYVVQTGFNDANEVTFQAAFTF